MKKEKNPWSKDELKTYILLLCAKADTIETTEELNLIRSLTNEGTFQKIYEEFSKDDQQQALEKIRDSIQTHDYSYYQLAKLRTKIEQVFSSDRVVLAKERAIEKILDTILY